MPSLSRRLSAGQFVTLASGNPEDSDALSIRANARVVAATIKAGHSADYQIAEGRKVYLVAATGAYSVNGVAAKARDGVAISDTQTISVSASEDTEIVLVDVE
ncbi:Putative Quercetin 2,3-dioxygenase [Pseudomonas marincola]|uniref:Putative Quercetin 2,3-dioxygenase n=1 Tax=Pseudomonas marincola TaxID=437900 RepID=A0A653EB75_9PSED|nr:Putative Quercetin 2,3-dioxygenase [Pseudomonas marincola]